MPDLRTQDLEPAPPVSLQTEHVSACPMCGSTDVRPWRTGSRDWSRPDAPDRLDYCECRSCGGYFLADRPLETELGKIYLPDYGPYQATQAARRRAKPHKLTVAASYPARALTALLRAVVPGHLEAELKRVYAPPRAGATLLDYGCGAPTFLDHARQLGWRTIGADFTDEVLGAVRQNGHDAFLVGEALEQGVSDRSIACIRMNHVVEHLYRPAEVLADLRQKLEPTGRIHISTPDPGSLGSKLFRRHWHALDSPRHIVLLRPRVLTGLLERTGFHHLRVIHETVPKDLTRSLGIWLYDRGRIEHEEIEGMAGDPIREPLAWPVSRAAAALGRSDRYHVFATA
jgi:2-polyprenyl-3-methyl-5-hydroxy-6-metoxy-1,4-benzoquinol methylase